jgi:hypothetical protein
MARSVVETSQAAAPLKESQEPEIGSVFINNFTNRIFKFSDGTQYQFKLTREVHTDPTLVKNLTELVNQGTHQVFTQ